MKFVIKKKYIILDTDLFSFFGAEKLSHEQNSKVFSLFQKFIFRRNKGNNKITELRFNPNIF